MDTTEPALGMSWLEELRSDCGSPEHEWVRCRSCAVEVGCPCSGGPCCRREMEDLAGEAPTSILTERKTG